MVPKITKAESVVCIQVNLEDKESHFVCDYLFCRSKEHDRLDSIRIKNGRGVRGRLNKCDKELFDKLFHYESLIILKSYGEQYANLKKNTASADHPYLYLKHLKQYIPELQEYETIYFKITPMRMYKYSVRTNVELSRGGNTTDLDFYFNEKAFPIYVHTSGVMHID